MTDAKRKYESPKRKEQAARTRERLLEVARSFLERNDPDELSLPTIARLAGVGASAVYANFASREALLHEVLGEVQKEMWTEARAIRRRVAARLFEIPFQVYPTYRANRGLLTAMVHSLTWQRHIGESRVRRRAEFLESLRPLAKKLDPDELEALAAVVQLLTAPRAWYFMEEDSGLAPELAERAIAFAIHALIEQLRREPTAMKTLTHAPANDPET